MQKKSKCFSSVCLKSQNNLFLINISHTDAHTGTRSSLTSCITFIDCKIVYQGNKGCFCHLHLWQRPCLPRWAWSEVQGASVSRKRQLLSWRRAFEKKCWLLLLIIIIIIIIRDKPFSRCLDDRLSVMSWRSAASCSAASVVLERAQKRREHFWGKRWPLTSGTFSNNLLNNSWNNIF